MGFLLAIVVVVPYLTFASIDSQNVHEARVKSIRENCIQYFQDPNCYEKLTGINPENAPNIDFRDLPRYSVDK